MLTNSHTMHRIQHTQSTYMPIFLTSKCTLTNIFISIMDNTSSHPILIPHLAVSSLSLLILVGSRLSLLYNTIRLYVPIHHIITSIHVINVAYSSDSITYFLSSVSADMDTPPKGWWEVYTQYHIIWKMHALMGPGNIVTCNYTSTQHR